MVKSGLIVLHLLCFTDIHYTLSFMYCIRTLTRNSWIHYTDYWIVKQVD